MLITFSGLDGAGKSTLIAWLRASLEAQDRRVTVLHMNDDMGLYAWLRAARDRALAVARRRRGARDGAAMPDESRARPATVARPTPSAAGTTGSERAPTMLRRLRNAVLWNRPLRRLIYPVDLVVFLCYRLWTERVCGRVLIMDRYFYDTLVDVSDGRHWRWVRLLERLTPTPTLPIYLDITPEVSFARKGEYTVEYLRRRWVAYRTVFPWVPSALRLPNDDFDATRRVLERALRERLPAA